VGTVIVDGKPAGSLAAGLATISLPSGAHTVEVQVEGMTAPQQEVNVVVNVQSEVTFDLKPTTTGPAVPSKPSHLRKTIGFVTLGVAGASAVGTAILAALFANDSGSFNTFRESIPTTITSICGNTSATAMATGMNPNQVTSACNQRSNADTEGSLAWTFGGIALGLAAVGVVLIVTDHGKEEGSPAAGSLRIVPTFGPGGGGISASLTF